LKQLIGAAKNVGIGTTLCLHDLGPIRVAKNVGAGVTPCLSDSGLIGVAKKSIGIGISVI